MPVPKVVIVGRPNVGKSSLFNWLIGHRVAIVDPTSGVTRDRNGFLLEVDGRFLELIDTGGMGVTDKDGLTAQIERQIDTAIDEASVVLFVTDAQMGIQPLDELVARKVRRCDKPVLCVPNKSDTAKIEMTAISEYSRFGHPLVPVSVIHRRNKPELIAEILARLPPADDEETPAVEMKIAVVGKRNVGKSTFINQLAQSERVIVSEVPGTTRDSVDVRFEHDGKAFVAIDTAGVKRVSSIADNIEYYSYNRAQKTIRRADVVLLFLDPTSRISKVEKQLAHYVIEQFKPCIFVVNKWDLHGNMTFDSFNRYIEDVFPTLGYAPRVFITAKSGKNTKALIDVARSLFHQARTRVSTPDLNRLFNEAIARQPPPTRQNKTPRIFFSIQVSTAPPTLVLFCNSPKLFDAPYQRYLLNVCRDSLPFSEVPIKLYLRRRDAPKLKLGSGDQEFDTEDTPDAVNVELDADSRLGADTDPELDLKGIRPPMDDDASLDEMANY